MRPRIVIDLGGLDALWPGAGLFRYAVNLVHSLHALRAPADFIVFGGLRARSPRSRRCSTGPGPIGPTARSAARRGSRPSSDASAG